VSLKVKLGPPNATAHVVDQSGKLIVTHDAMGLPVDPINYAKRSCRLCYGRGVYTRVRPLSQAQMATLFAENAQLAENAISDGNQLKTLASCECARRGYERAAARREKEMWSGRLSVFLDGEWRNQVPG